MPRAETSSVAEEGESFGPSHWRSRGRAIRRLVSLAERIDDILDSIERRGTPNERQTPAETQLVKSYQSLINRFPEFSDWLKNPANANERVIAIKNLTEGADSARADDASNLKSKVVAWLIELDPANHNLSSYDKSGRGLYNDSTGRLLCPVDYDWDNPELQAQIRDWHPEYLVTANAWPGFLYKDGKYDPAHPAEGLFMGDMLVRAFKLLFTSPSSAEQMDPTEQTRAVQPPRLRRRGERRTRAPVAQLISMRSVEPRAIAYTAVQLRFALSDCGSWRLQDGVFHHNDFYNNIIRWFEDVEDVADQEFVKNLVYWWNRKIFGRDAVAQYANQATENLSVSASFRRGRASGTMQG